MQVNTTASSLGPEVRVPFVPFEKIPLRNYMAPLGAPVQYVPLSVQMPDLFRQLQEQQTRYSEEQAWWPCRKLTIASTEPSQEIADSSCPDSPLLQRPFSTMSLQEDLLNAISTPFVPQPQLPLQRNPTAPPRHETGPAAASGSATIPPVKTSDTHPIK